MMFYNSIRSSMRAFRSSLGGARNVLVEPQGRGVLDMNKEDNFLDEQMAVYAGINHLRRTPFTDNQTGESQEMRLKYRYALAEPAVKAALLGKIISVCSLSLNVRPVDRHNQRDREVADCVKHAIKANDKGVPGVLWEMLSGGLIDGWSLSEKVWKRETRGRWRGYKVLDNLKSKDTRYILPEVDRYLNVTGYYNMRGNAGKRFETDDFILFNYLSLFQNPCGMSDLRASYRAIEFLPAVMRMRMTFLEKFKGPFIHGAITDSSLRQKMMNELYEARAKGYIVTDKSTDLKILDMAMSGTADFQEMINDLRQEIAIGISGAFLHMLTGSAPDERGNTKVQQETTEGFVWILADMAANRLQRHMVPDIVDNNFGSQTECPEIILEAVNPKDIKAQLEIYQILHSMGLDLSVDEIFDKARVSTPNDPKDALKGSQGVQVSGFGGTSLGMGGSLSTGNNNLSPTDM